MKKNKESELYRIEMHLWFSDFNEYASREKELHELLGQLHGDASIIIFFQSTPEYLEIPGACYDHMNDEQAGKLIDFCSRTQRNLHKWRKCNYVACCHLFFIR